MAKNPGGRPSVFSDRIQKQIKFLATEGFTDKKIARAVGITEQTINNWKKAHPKFFESLKDWKAIADSKVEKSLYQKCIGFEYDEVTTEAIKLTDNKELQGAKIIRTVRKMVVPSDTAIKFWLTNRKRDEWKNRYENINRNSNQELKDLSDDELEKRLKQLEK